LLTASKGFTIPPDHLDRVNLTVLNLEMKLAALAIIGGTGLETLPSEWTTRQTTLQTEFGPAAVTFAALNGLEIILVPRHGAAHDLLPHQINYRANIAALRELGIRKALATNAVGSLRLDLPPGSLIALDDFLDFTRARPVSFWERTGAEQEASPRETAQFHTDFSYPYCPALRSALLEAAADLDAPLLPRGVYVCSDGPRFESPAEVRMFAQLGGDVVGMTGLPEAVFAREAGICYAAVAIVTNFAAGITPARIDHNEVIARMSAQVEQVRALLLATARMPHGLTCPICT
jgi:5'-methylthioadenosine phosphorylase